MQGLRTSVMAGLTAALFGCGAAPQLDEAPIVGRPAADPPAAQRETLDRNVADYGRARFTVTGSRYAFVDGHDRDWQPLLAKLAKDPAIARMQSVRLPTSPRDWQLALWRGRGNKGLLVAMLFDRTEAGEQLVGYYSVALTADFDPPARGNVES